MIRSRLQLSLLVFALPLTLAAGSAQSGRGTMHGYVGYDDIRTTR